MENNINNQNPQNQDQSKSSESIFDNLIAKANAEKQQEKDNKNENKILDGILEKKASENVLNIPNKKDLSLTKMFNARKQLSLGWTILKVVVLIAFLSFGYFSYELSPSFTYLDNTSLGKNSINTLTSTKEKIQDLQSQTNANNVVAAQIKIDRFAYLYDLFNYYQERIEILEEKIKYEKNEAIKAKLVKKINDVYVTEQKKAAEEIFSSLEFVKSRMQKPFYPENINLSEEEKTALIQDIDNRTKNKISEMKTKKENGLDILTLSDELTYDGASRLLTDKALIIKLKTLNFDSLKSEYKSYLAEKNSKKKRLFRESDFYLTLKDLSKDINGFAKNDFSVVAKIKENRIKWTEFITNINNLTQDLDAYYYDDKVRRIFYSSFSFDSKQKTISVTGMSRRFEPYNFTLLADLIDTFEKSGIFQDVVMSGFNKSKQGDYYTAPINMSFKIQNGIDSRDTMVSFKEYLENFNVNTKDSSDDDKKPDDSKTVKVNKK